MVVDIAHANHSNMLNTKKTASPTIQNKVYEYFGSSSSSSESSPKLFPQEEPPQAQSVTYTWKQTKAMCDILEKKLKIKFWICLSEEDRENEKESPSSTVYYRLGFCKYGNAHLVNILRFWQDKSKYVKSKSYATINLAIMQTTKNSSNKFSFTEKEAKKIRSVLGI